MNSFKDLNLSPDLMRAIEELGYEKPSPIQAEALPILLDAPTDFLGLAATGTGKTAAFSIPLLERLDPEKRSVQALILCPTRELALQVAGQINLLGKFLGVSALPIYGGSSYGDQIRGLKRGAQVVVGTPGRLVDHMEKGTLDLSELAVVILDEADEMISMGFKEDLESILSAAPRETSHIWLFSATMSPEVRRMADGYLVDPAFVQINRTEMLPDTIEQIYYKTHESDKPEILCKLIEAADDFYGLVFCQTKALVVDLTNYLKGRGYQVDCLHGDMDQDARERTMRAFRERKVKLLICTDVASRGLDVKDITHVINYSLPRELDNYVHRIGRTARSGKTGIAMSLVTPSHKGLITRIERMTKSRMKEGRIPSRRDVGAKKVSKALAAFESVQEQGYTRAISLLDDAWKAALAELSPEEVAGRFIALMNADVFEDREEEPAPAPAPKVAPLKAPVQVTVRGAERPAYVKSAAKVKAKAKTEAPEAIAEAAAAESFVDAAIQATLEPSAPAQASEASATVASESVPSMPNKMIELSDIELEDDGAPVAPPARPARKEVKEHRKGFQAHSGPKPAPGGYSKEGKEHGFGAPRERKPFFKRNDEERGLGRGPRRDWGHRGSAPGERGAVGGYKKSFGSGAPRGESRPYVSGHGYSSGGGYVGGGAKKSPWGGKPRPKGDAPGAGKPGEGGGFSKDFSGKSRSRFDRPLTRGNR